MVANPFARELKRGSTELLILALLEERDRHGYDLARLIEERSRGAISFNVASLYPTLYRMEEKGLIEGRWVEKSRPAAPALLLPHRGRNRDARQSTGRLGFILRGTEPGRSHSPRIKGTRMTGSLACAQRYVPPHACYPFKRFRWNGGMQRRLTGTR